MPNGSFSKALGAWKHDSYGDWGVFEKDGDIGIDNKELQKLMSELQKSKKWLPYSPAPKTEPEPTKAEKEAKEAASLKRFMTSCWNKTSDFTKCDYCEFRFKCLTEVASKRKKKNVNNSGKRKGKVTTKKMPNYPPRIPQGGVILDDPFDRFIIKNLK